MDLFRLIRLFRTGIEEHGETYFVFSFLRNRTEQTLRDLFRYFVFFVSVSSGNEQTYFVYFVYFVPASIRIDYSENRYERNEKTKKSKRDI